MSKTTLPRPLRLFVSVLLAVLVVLTVAASCAKAKHDVAAAGAKAGQAAEQAKDGATTAVNEAADKLAATAVAVGETAKEKTAEVAADARQASNEFVATVKDTSAVALAAAEAKTAEVRGDLEARRVAMVHDLQQHLGGIDAGIASLQQRLARAQGDGKEELGRSLATVRVKRVELRERMAKLGDKSGAAWDDVAAGVRSAEHELEQAIEKALARFK